MLFPRSKVRVIALTLMLLRRLGHLFLIGLLGVGLLELIEGQIFEDLTICSDFVLQFVELMLLSKEQVLLESILLDSIGLEKRPDVCFERAYLSHIFLVLLSLFGELTPK